MYRHKEDKIQVCHDLNLSMRGQETCFALKVGFGTIQRQYPRMAQTYVTVAKHRKTWGHS